MWSLILSIGLGCLFRKTKVDLMYPDSKRGALILRVGLSCLFRKTKVDLMYLDSKCGALILSVGLLVLSAGLNCWLARVKAFGNLMKFSKP